MLFMCQYLPSESQISEDVRIKKGILSLGNKLG